MCRDDSANYIPVTLSTVWWIWMGGVVCGVAGMTVALLVAGFIK